MKLSLFLLFLLTGCTFQDARTPASVPPVSSQSVFIPVRIICSAPATSQGIFQFSGDGDSLIAEFQGAGEALIKGNASVLLRDQGDTSAFEGLITVQGRRTPDAKTYSLNAKVNSEQWTLDLRREGDSTITIQNARGKRSYHANCTDTQ